ncbi:MAG: spore coat protein U domain-containing protein [Terracidiphilus sp.]
MMRRLTLAVLFMSLLGGAHLATAQACTLTDTAMNFGTYTDGDAAVPGTSTGTVVCGGTWDIPLDAGTGAGASETIRYMTGPGGAKIAYGVFQDLAHQTNWGNTSTTEVTGTGNATVTFYGLITAGQVPAPGTYTDTLTTATTTFPVSVTVAKACTITATNLNFYTYVKTLIDASSTIFVTCTNTTTYTIGLSAGNAPGATVTTRKMQYGANLLSYSLTSGSYTGTNWGNTSPTWVAGTGTGAQQSLTVYGELPAGQNVPAGNYTDTITATITY